MTKSPTPGHEVTQQRSQLKLRCKLGCVGGGACAVRGGWNEGGRPACLIAVALLQHCGPGVWGLGYVFHCERGWDELGILENGRWSFLALVLGPSPRGGSSSEQHKSSFWGRYHGHGLLCPGLSAAEQAAGVYANAADRQRSRVPVT